MKTNYKYLFMAGLLSAGMTACVDDNDWGTDSSYNRLFGAQDIQVSAMATKTVFIKKTIIKVPGLIRYANRLTSWKG